MNIRKFLELYPPNNDKGFGAFVEQRRKELGITLKHFSDATKISSPYLIDIEKGQRPAPLNYLEDYRKILQISDNDATLFLDLAYCTRKNHPDINEYLNKTPNARKFLRLAKDLNLTDKELANLILSIEETKNNEYDDSEEPEL